MVKPLEMLHNDALQILVFYPRHPRHRRPWGSLRSSAKHLLTMLNVISTAAWRGRWVPKIGRNRCGRQSSTSMAEFGGWLLDVEYWCHLKWRAAWGLSKHMLGFDAKIGWCQPNTCWILTRTWGWLSQNVGTFNKNRIQRKHVNVMWDHNPSLKTGNTVISRS